MRDRLRHRPRGSRRLATELRGKGVAADRADAAIERVFDDEEVTDRALALRVAEQWVARQGTDTLAALASEERTAASAKARRRLVGYLSRRGFGGTALGQGVKHAVAQARVSATG